MNIKRSKIAALIGLLGILPFVILEWTTTSGFTEKDFPLAVFSFMGLSIGIFAFTLMSLFQDIQKGSSRINPVTLVIKIAVLIFLAIGFINLIADQLPCFLGVPNCD